VRRRGTFLAIFHLAFEEEPTTLVIFEFYHGLTLTTYRYTLSEAWSGVNWADLMHGCPGRL